MPVVLTLPGKDAATRLEGAELVLALVRATEADLDDLVHDCADADAAAMFNDGAGPHTGDASADADDVHTTLGAEAADINNDGLPAQIAYLIVALGHAQVTRELAALGVDTTPATRAR